MHKITTTKGTKGNKCEVDRNVVWDIYRRNSSYMRWPPIANSDFPHDTILVESSMPIRAGMAR